jgi:hypothetical protein
MSNVSGANNLNQPQNIKHHGDVGEFGEVQEEILEDLGVAEDDDDIDEADGEFLEKRGVKKKERSRKKSKKPNSVALLKKEIDGKDLLKDFTDKLSSKKKTEYQKELSEKFKDEYSDHLQDIVQEEVASRFSDSVRLSAKEESKKNEFRGKSKSMQQIKTDIDKKQKKEFTAQQDYKSQSKSQADRLETQQKVVRQQGSQASQSQTELEDSMQQYLSEFAESVITDTAKKKKEAADLKKVLLAKGASQKALTNMESQAQKLIHSDLKKMMKQSFIDIGFNFDPKSLSRELLNSFEGFKQMVDLSEKVGVFGEGRTKKKEMREEARSELKDFINTEMDRTLIETRLKTDDIGDLVKAFDKMNNLAGYARFDSASYMKQFQQKLEHYGLETFTHPDPPKGQMDNKSGGQQNKKKRVILEIEEGAVLGDKLRHLYLKKLVTHSAVDGLKLNWEIFKAERELKKSGQADQISMIHAETQNTGKLKLVFMLRDVFEERATLPDLKGPAYNINKKRLKDILKGLKSLGTYMPKSELTMFRDQSNKAMFSIIKEDYIRLELFLKNDPTNFGLKQKRENYLKILDRLKSESNINESIQSRLMQDLNFLSDVNIVEAV